MYRVDIGGYYSGHFSTLGEAMMKVQEAALPFCYRWQIQDGFNKVVARG